MVINKLSFALPSSKAEKNDKIEKTAKKESGLEKVSQEFEAIFIKKLFDEMDKTVDRKNSIFYGGQGEEIFRSMLNEERAKDMSKNGGIGLAKVIYEQLSRNSKEGTGK